MEMNVKGIGMDAMGMEIETAVEIYCAQKKIFNYFMTDLRFKDHPPN